MIHVKEKEEQALFFSDGFDATFEEAVEFMKEKLSLTWFGPLKIVHQSANIRQYLRP